MGILELNSQAVALLDGNCQAVTELTMLLGDLLSDIIRQFEAVLRYLGAGDAQQ